jgi:beta-glucosidase
VGVRNPRKPSRPKTLPYLDPSLPIDDRVADLVGRMTLEEKISQTITPAPAIPHLRVPAMRWHNECLHGLVHTGRATQFPQSIGMAATFDAELIQKVADAIATEARAKYHDPKWHGPKGARVGINFWTPNINLLRDPRWGRGQETYGEDPFLTGLIGAAFVRGLQGSHPLYLKAAACAKHFAVHSGPEALRAQFDARVSQKDLFETYLPAFKALVDAGVETVMATYNRVNGEACPASPTLLQKILRDAWHFDGHVVSDGGAISAMHTSHKVSADATDSAVMALKAGCDLCNEGNAAYLRLPEALAKGLVTEAEIDTAAARVLRTEFRLGLFDDPKKVPYTKIRGSVVARRQHIELARKSALESLVLVKNDGVLPLTKASRTVCVTGPTAADCEVLQGNFYRGVSDRFVTILEGVTGRAHEGTAVVYLPGCFVAHPNLSRSNWHLGLVENADVVVGVVGLSPLMEGEAGECIASEGHGDRIRVGLPTHQIEFVKGLASKGKPLVLVVTGGSAVSLTEVADLANAIVYAWYPGEQGGNAVGDVLFGRESPSGRLPVTIPRSVDDLPDFADYSMANRTYRYARTEPMYPFGFGLSYVRFAYGPLKLSSSKIARGKSVKAELDVQNLGDRAADEVVQLYVTDDDASTRTPRWALKGVRRVRILPGKKVRVKFQITPAMMELVTEEGTSVLEPGTFTVTVGSSSPDPKSVPLGAPKPAQASFELA